MTKRPIQDLISIARAGGSFRIHADAYTAYEFSSLAKSLLAPASRLYINGSSKISSRDLKSLAQLSGGKCVFEE